MTISPYLNFDGSCAEAMRLYERVLGGTMETMMTFEGSPAEEAHPEMRDRVLHASLRVGEFRIMASDAPPAMFTPASGTYVCIGADSVEEGRRIFQELAEGGTVHMPFEPTFWSAGFGMLADRFGTLWMIDTSDAADSAPA